MLQIESKKDTCDPVIRCSRVINVNTIAIGIFKEVYNE